MKYCSKCGSKISDESVVCPNCGCRVCETTADDGLKTTAKAFMLIGCVSGACFFLIPLLWCIPMYISYCNKIKNGEPVSTGFKVCCLLFVNTIAGIIMLCDQDKNASQINSEQKFDTDELESGSDGLEEEINKLILLKEKNLITDEEYKELRKRAIEKRL